MHTVQSCLSVCDGLAGRWVGHTCGPSLPGTSIVMLLPLSKIWSSLVMRRPSGVSSLQTLERRAGVCTVCTAHVATYNSVTSSNTMSGSRVRAQRQLCVQSQWLQLQVFHYPTLHSLSIAVTESHVMNLSNILVFQTATSAYGTQVLTVHVRNECCPHSPQADECMRACSQRHTVLLE